MLGFWYNYIGYINLATTILVPLGVLLHYLRVADRHPPVARGLSADAAAFWQRSARRVIGQGWWASGCAITLAVPFIYMQNTIFVADHKWITSLGPLIAVTVILVVFLWRPAPRRPLNAASQDLGLQIDPGQRRVWSLGRRWWFVCTICSVAILVLSVIAAGLLSSPDENGDYNRLSITLGSGGGYTEFLGWYYGVPILVATAVLTLVTLAALWMIARPPLATSSGERAIDVWLRSRSTRAVICLSCGAVVLTLAHIWVDIGNASQLRVTNGAGVSAGTSIAVLSIPLIIAGQLLKGLGFTLLLLPLLTKSPHLSFAAPTDVYSGDNHMPDAALPETAEQGPAEPTAARPTATGPTTTEPSTDFAVIGRVR